MTYAMTREQEAARVRYSNFGEEEHTYVTVDGVFVSRLLDVPALRLLNRGRLPGDDYSYRLGQDYQGFESFEEAQAAAAAVITDEAPSLRPGANGHPQGYWLVAWGQGRWRLVDEAYRGAHYPQAS